MVCVLAISLGHVGELFKILVGESGQLDVMPGLVQFFEHVEQLRLVNFGKFGKPVVGNHVGDLGLFVFVILKINRRVLIAQQERGVQTAMPARDAA